MKLCIDNLALLSAAKVLYCMLDVLVDLVFLRC